MNLERLSPPRRAGVRMALLSLCVLLTACEAPGEAEPAAGSEMSQTAVSFSSARVRNGGVRWAPAQTAMTSSSIEVPGQLAPDGDRSAQLGSPVQGRVLRVHVRPGERVERAQPLVTLTSPEASAARADHEKARAAVTSQRAAAVYARTARERAERLYAAKAASRQELERAQADDELARSELAQAEAELARTQGVLLQYGVDGGAGEVVLRAPFAGVVLTREAQPGAVVAPGTPLVSVADPTTLWLEASVSDRAAGTLQIGAPVRFNVATFPADTFTATVQSVGGALDPTTRTLPVRATVQNADGRLRPEMFATVWIEGGAPRSAVVVPDAALQLLDRRPVVFVAVPDGKGGARFERRDVETGGSSGGRTQILKGLQAGESVVVEGAFAVKSEFARSKMAEG